MPNPRRQLMAAAGAGGPQVIAPSSNDWDYTFGVIAASGNALGDNTSGGNVSAVQATEALSGLITLDGDFIIAFKLVNRTNFAFGVHAHDEDDVRANNAHAGMNSMTNSFWWGIDYGTSGTQAMNGSTGEGSFTAPANNDELILRRVGGTITLENVTTAATLRTFTSTYSGTMRLAFANGTGTTASVTDLFITDSSKIQRDGFYNESAGVGDFLTGWANTDTNGNYYARRIPCSRSGNVTEVKMNCTVFGVAYDSRIDIYSDDGTSPVSLLGGSDTLTLNSTGEKIWTFSAPVSLIKGRKYWYVIIDEDEGSGDIDFQSTAAISGHGTGVSAVGITSIVDNTTSEFRMEVTIEETAEPTPVHGILALIQSNTTDGSTTFTELSQEARTITNLGSCEHDTAQSKHGSSSILFPDDGSGVLTIPDSVDFEFGGALKGDFTIGGFFRFATTTGEMGLISKIGSGESWAESPWGLYKSVTHALRFGMSNNGGTGVDIASSSTISVGTWYHLMVCRSRGVINLFFDGTLETSSAADYQIANTAIPVQFGRKASGGTTDFDGWADQLVIADYAFYDDDFTVPVAAYPS